MIGKTLGNYEILQPLGAGGMGEVYRAHDTNLKRDVAVKVLPEEVSGDPDRLARLEREAYLLASLNHPNIATIFGLEEIDGTRFLVLELIEGESLQQRLERGPLPIEQALDVCGQIARALEVAHGADIVHRDLKPANVLITVDDRAKVLDFGIAKALGRAGDDGATEHVTELTAAGTLVGTAPYMSPEQVRGEAVDKRSDVWAFGCILFETLAGEGPFTRETVADTLAAIVGNEPNWESLPAEASPAVRMLLHRCLQKNPKVRQRDIGDAWVEINQSRSLAGGVPMSMPPTIARPGTAGLRSGIAAVLVAGALAAGALAGWWFTREAPVSALPLRFDFELPRGASLPSSEGPAIAISPDGVKVVVVARGGFGDRLFLHRLDQGGEPQPIPGTEGGRYPFFSPDGRTIAFDAPNGNIETVSLDGDDSDTLCRQCRHGTWGDDNSIIVQPTGDAVPSRLARIAEAGVAELEFLPQPALGEETLHPDRFDLLPGSRALLFEEGGAIYAYSLDSRAVNLVQHNASNPLYAGGYVLFPRTNTLYAVPFDVTALQPTGARVVVQRGVNTEGGGALQVAVSRQNGVLVFAPVEAEKTSGYSLRWVDRTGEWEELVTDPQNFGGYPRVSPDGERIAFMVAPEPAGIWLFDQATKVASTFQIIDKVTTNRINHPVWSRDGQSITYMEIRTTDSQGEAGREFAIVRKRVGGSRASETLFTAPFRSSQTPVPADWTAGDEHLLYGTATVYGHGILHLLSAANDATAPGSVVFESDYGPKAYTLSHDGRWLAYVANRLGSDARYSTAVYVRAFPDGDEIPVSPPGGSEPRWGPGDRELFYVRAGKLWSARVSVQDGSFTVEPAEELFDLAAYPGDVRVPARYDVHPDGNRFAMIRPNSVDDIHRINVVVNWFQEIGQPARERQEGG